MYLNAHIGWANARVGACCLAHFTHKKQRSSYRGRNCCIGCCWVRCYCVCCIKLIIPRARLSLGDTSNFLAKYSLAFL